MFLFFRSPQIRGEEIDRERQSGKGRERAREAQYFYMILFVLRLPFTGICASPCVSFYPFSPSSSMQSVNVCMQRFRIKYKLVRKYYDNAAAAVGCCYSSGAFYGLVNIIFISIFVFLFFSHLFRCYFFFVFHHRISPNNTFHLFMFSVLVYVSGRLFYSLHKPLAR